MLPTQITGTVVLELKIRPLLYPPRLSHIDAEYGQTSALATAWPARANTESLRPAIAFLMALESITNSA
jgi:hypothetical protein